MKPGRLKKFSLILSSLFGILIPVQLSDACGWVSDGYEPYTVILDRGFFSPKGNTFELYSDVLFDFNPEIKDDHDRNVEEWRKFLNGLGKDETHHLVYSADEQDLRMLEKELSSKTSTTDVSRSLSAVEGDNVIKYLMFVRKCQPYVNAFDDWAGCFEKNDVFTGIIQEGEELAKKITSDFLKLRIGYQLCRLAHYTGEFQKCTGYYNQYFTAEVPQSIVSYWAMAHYAASLKAAGKNADAQFYYSKVYRNSSTKRYSSFKSMDYSNIDSALAMTSDPADKITLYVLNSLENMAGNLDNMKAIHRIDPKSPELEVLLYKEIYSYEMNNGWEYANGKFHPAPELLDFTEKVITQGEMFRPYIWHISAGYLSFINKSYEKAHWYYSKAKNSADGNVLYLKQYITLLEVVLKAAETKKINTTFEESLQRYLTAMDAFQEGSRLYKASQNISQYVYRFLYTNYLEQGDIVKAELVAPLFSFEYEPYEHTIYNHPDSMLVSKMIKFINDPDLNTFEKYLLGKSPYTLESMYELQGTMLMRGNHLKEAIAAFEKSGDLNAIPGDPFETKTIDCVDCGNDSTALYTKKSLAEQMLKYEKQAVSEPKKAAEYYLLLGNAWYNTTAYGHTWKHLAYARPYGDLGETADPFVDFYQNGNLDTAALALAYAKLPDSTQLYPGTAVREKAYYYDCSRALIYYTKALKISTDKEFKAKCAFMAAKCEENARYVKEPINGLPIGSHKFYGKLYSEYADTKFYSEIIAECSYLRNYKELRESK